jgi:C1A family cysteine protease
LSRSSIKSFDFLKKEVSSGNVTILVGGYYNGSTRNGGHAVTLIGYDVTDGKNYLQIYDPWDGTIKKCTYSNFKSGFGNRQYDGTVWNQE